MVTIITEKLRNQSLDDVKVEPVPGLQTSGKAWAFTASSSSALQLPSDVTGGKGWTMFVDGKERWPSQQPTPGTTAKTTPSASGLPVSGGIAATSKSGGASHHPAVTPIQVPSVPSDAPGNLMMADLDSLPNTPPAPPLKRHCRSLSNSKDTATALNDHPTSSNSSTASGSAGTSSSSRACGRWQPQAGQIWRPVASRAPHHHATKHHGMKTRSSTSHHHSSGSGNSTHHHHHHHYHHHHPRPISSSRSSPRHQNTGTTTTKTISDTTPSVDTATTREGALPTDTTLATPATVLKSGTNCIWPLSKSEDFSTPPESPVPRPASASSGLVFSPGDGGCSYGSLVNSGWLDKQASGSTGSGIVGQSAHEVTAQSTGSQSYRSEDIPAGNNNNNYMGGARAGDQEQLQGFRLRSLSMEEPISRIVSTTCSNQVPCSTGGGVGRGGTCSMPVIPGSTSGSRGNWSTPSSPRGHRVQRCRSQPCVLQDRPKCLKRRRDEERPALDFLKMTETAYDYGAWRRSGRCPQNIRVTRSLASLYSAADSSSHCVHSLNTIASSPLDTSNNMPPVNTNTKSPPLSSISFTYSPKHTSSVTQRGHSETCSFHHHPYTAMPPSSSSSSSSGGRKLRSMADNSEYHHRENTGVIEDAFIDCEVEASSQCDCHHPNNANSHSVVAGGARECEAKQFTADGEMFEMELNSDIDIDQIEKD